MLNITVTGDRETIVKFDKVSAALHAQILNVTKKYAVNLQQHVKGDKLSGQVLNRRSGALSSSIKLAVDDNGQAVYGRVFSSGDVKYAAFWEFGFQGTEQVTPHQRIVSQVFGRKCQTARNRDPLWAPKRTPSLWRCVAARRGAMRSAAPGRRVSCGRVSCVWRGVWGEFGSVDNLAGGRRISCGS